MVETAVIFVAGRGTRLMPFTKYKPKCLLKVDNRTIIEHILFAISKSVIRDVVLIVGYKRGMIKRAIGYKKYGLRIQYIDNVHYKEYGTAFSLSCAIELIRGKSILLVEGDLLCEPEALQLLVNCENEDALMVDRMAEMHERKGDVVVIGQKGRLEKLIILSSDNTSVKSDVEERSMLMIKLSVKAVDSLVCSLSLYRERCLKKKQDNVSVYRFIEQIAKSYPIYFVFNNKELMWMNVNTYHDLKIARSIFKGKFNV